MDMGLDSLAAVEFRNRVQATVTCLTETPQVTSVLELVISCNLYPSILIS